MAAGVVLRVGTTSSGLRFETYVEALSAALGHADRVTPFRSYCAGLTLPGDRKSVEPMAARVEPGRVQAARQSLRHLVARAEWSIKPFWRRCVRRCCQGSHALAPSTPGSSTTPACPRRAGTRSAWRANIAADLAGRTIVGSPSRCRWPTTRHACPSITGCICPSHGRTIPRGALAPECPMMCRSRPGRRSHRGRSGLSSGRAACLRADRRRIQRRHRVPRRHHRTRAVLRRRHPVFHQPVGARARRPSRSSRGTEAAAAPRHACAKPPTNKPISAMTLAQALPEAAWQTVTWREGGNATLSGRFAAVRVRPAHRDVKCRELRPEEWFMVEWPLGDDAPARYWFSTRGSDMTLSELVAHAKRRWRIERDYQELKQEIGLGHYEGRGWRGFHHHATVCIAAYGFLISERSAIPRPPAKRRKPILKAAPLPEGFRPRGSADSA